MCSPSLTAAASPGRWKTISGTTQFGEVFSRNRTASPMSSVRIMSSGLTCSRTNSVMSVSTKPGHSATDLMPSPLSSLFIACVQAITAALVAE